MKAVVLAAGRGRRMREADPAAVLSAEQARAAAEGAKAAMPLDGDGRPFLDFVLSGLADAGVCDVCVVLAPGRHSFARRYASLPMRRLRLSFATQAEPRGTADAVLCAADRLGRDDFLALNADNLYPVSAYRALQALDGQGLPVFERRRLLESSNIPPERIAAFAAVRVGAGGMLEEIVEKPGDAEMRRLGNTDFVSMNLWRLSEPFLEACRRVPRSVRGERELPQAVQYAIAELGQRFRAVPCSEGVLDLSARADVAAVAARLRDVAVNL